MFRLKYKTKTDATVIVNRQFAEHCLNGEYEHIASPSLKHRVNPRNV